jgi:hypothetical protein
VKEGEYRLPSIWQPYISGKLEIHTVHCKHYEMTEPAPIKTIGKILNQKLREITASTQTVHIDKKPNPVKGELHDKSI